MALNKVILYGRLTAEPIYRQTQSGIGVVRFTVACDRAFADKQTGKREADFIEVQAWRNTADFVSRYFHKGDAITVEGSLRNNNYEDKNGVKHYTYVVMADQVGFGGRSENQGNQQGQRQAPQQNKQSKSTEGLDLSGFEDILSEGTLPF